MQWEQLCNCMSDALGKLLFILEKLASFSLKVSGKKKHTQSKQNHEWNSAWDFKRLFLRFIFICMNNNNCEAKIKFAFHEKLLLIIMSLKKLSSFNLMKKFNWSEKLGDDDEMRKRSSWEQVSLLKWRLWKWKMTKENNFLKRISE